MAHIVFVTYVVVYVRVVMYLVGVGNVIVVVILALPA